MSSNDDKLMQQKREAYIIAEVIRLAGEAMRRHEREVEIEFGNRPFIRATNRASMNKDSQLEAVEALKKMKNNWTFLFDASKETLHVTML